MHMRRANFCEAAYFAEAVVGLCDAAPNPNRPLVGDTGQHDAFVYRDAIDRHPQRVLAVVLREPGPGPDSESKGAMESIEEMGTPLFHAVTFDGLAVRIGPLAEQTHE